MKTAHAMIVRRGFPLEVRTAEERDGDENTEPSLRIEGYAAVFDQEVDLGYFREVIRAGAFTKTLQEGDQIALWNHDTNQTLARKSQGTLELKEDEHGLWFGADLDPRIERHRDAFFSIQRGDVGGTSFGFSVVKEDMSGTEESQLREIRETRLFEVSPTPFPAYEMTEVEARSVLDRIPTSEPEPAFHSEAEDVARNAAKRKRNLKLLEITR